MRPVCSVQDMRDALVLVHVVDPSGEPMKDIAVTLVPRGGKAAPMRMETDASGRAVFRLSADATMRVTAGFVGFFTSVADRVEAKVGCVAALTLAMQVEPARNPVH